MRTPVWTGCLAVALALAPAPALAQCGMMGGGGGGHDHGSAAAGSRPSSADRKARQAVDKVLADERSRAVLAEALLEEPAFLRALIARMLEEPEWHALVARQLAEATEPSLEPAAEDSVRATRPRSGQATTVYTCPMHPEVRSARPGSCPECGMTLRASSRAATSQ